MKKNYLIYLGIAAAVVLAYLWYKGRNATAVPVAGVQNPNGTVTVLPPGVQTTTITNPVTQQSSNAIKTNGGTTIPQAVIDWVSTLGPNNQQAFYAAVPLMSDAEVAGITDLVVTGWSNGNPTPTQKTFWNSFYPKYRMYPPFTADNFSKAEKMPSRGRFKGGKAL